MFGRARRLGRDERGAVAPTVALSLIALIATGGLAFDYARMASLDTELQNAADQAALAAATQLDGKAGAMSRATLAAQNMVANETLMANEPGTTTTPAITVSAANVIFYTRNTSSEDGLGPVATTDADARIVSVTVDGRTAHYALTPIVAAFNSGAVTATAVASLGSSVCKVPPLMMCNPAETGTSTAINLDEWRGRGIRLVANGPGASWGPGVFGYLQADLGNGANALEAALGANSPAGDCQATDSVTVEPGVQTSVTDAINTRFDIYESGLVGYCDNGNCSPALNTRKDVVHSEFPAPGGTGKAPNCSLQGNDGWEGPSTPYLPNSLTDPGTTPTNMGHPRDICHSIATPNCANGRIGDGNWDRSLYFSVNHGGATDLAAAASWAGRQATATAGANALSRYDVYLWEIHAGRLATRFANVSKTGDMYSYAAPQCGTGVGPGPSQADRRKLTVAMVNCIEDGGSLNGSATVRPAKWIEVFLVEPSKARARTSQSDIYVEMIGEALPVANGNNMTVRREVPYLIR